MSHRCVVKVLDKLGKEIERFNIVLYRSYDVGEKLPTVEHGKHITYMVVEKATMTVQEVEGE